MIKLSELKKEWIKDPDIEKHYKDLKPEFEMAREFIRARVNSNMTQSDVAKKMKTTQSVIARLESGKAVPTMKTIGRFAKAVGMNFEFHFVAAQG
jgi:ribosome-binding protein aMBF1 (putative translation factor)